MATSFMCAPSLEQRDAMLPVLEAAGIACHFHYQSLHKSAYAQRMGWTAMHRRSLHGRVVSASPCIWAWPTTTWTGSSTTCFMSGADLRIVHLAFDHASVRALHALLHQDNRTLVVD